MKPPHTCPACKNPTHKCDCFTVGRSKQRGFVSPKQHSPNIPEGIKHGLSAYAKHGCRCDVCLDVWRAYQRERYAKKKAKFALEGAK